MQQIKPQSTKMRWLQCFQKQHTKNYMASSNSFFDCYTPLRIKCITRIRLGLSLCESMNSNITFRIHSILYVTVVMMLIEPAIHFSSTAPYIVMNVTQS